MVDSETGLSSPKRLKIQAKKPHNLASEESEMYLGTGCESEDEFTGEDDDSSYSEEDAASSSENESDEENDAPADVTANIDAPVVSKELDVEWGDVEDIQDFKFTKTKGLLVQPSDNGTPIDYFFFIANERFFNLLLEETNKYAETVFLSGAKVNSRITAWRPLTLPELHKFLGLLFHMGTIKINRMCDYWSTDRLFGLTCFSEHMARDRFLLILSCLHFSKNDSKNEQSSDDGLEKIKPVIDFFNDRMLEIYQPGKPLSLDEYMILWRGRPILRQNIKNEFHRNSVKIYMLTEPNGIILNVSIHCGVLDIVDGGNHATDVVMHLMKDRLGCGHALYMDKFYTSYNLAKKLLKHKTYCTGTLHADKPGNPKDVVKAKLVKGQTTGKYKEGVLVGKWRDKKEVLYISTEFTNDMVEIINKRNKVVHKPSPIVRYKENMDDIDRQDQMLAYYPCSRKTVRWYKQLGVHFIQLMLLNAHYLYDQYAGKKMSFYDFRLTVIRNLLGIDKGAAKRPQSKQNTKHITSKIKATNGKGQTKRKRCQVCSKNKIRKSTVYHCEACPGAPGLCVGECFSIYHRN